MADLTYKIGTFGESRVGKTCIIKKYVDNSFDKVEPSSSSSSIFEKALEIEKHDVLLKIWDTAGQERLMALTKQYFQGLDGILLVYDVTKKETFEKLQFWIKTIQEHIDINTVIINLAANKTDMIKERQVSEEEGKKAASSLGVEYFEVSAKTGANIEEIFDNLANKLYRKRHNQHSNTVALNNEGNKKKKEGCCGGNSKK